jgi:hypothetical protein
VKTDKRRVLEHRCVGCNDQLPPGYTFQCCESCRAAAALQKATAQCRGIYRCIRCGEKGHNVRRCQKTA